MECSARSECFLTKFIIKGEIVYIKVLWKNSEDDLFDIKLVSGEKSWSGKFSCELARKFAENFEENDEEYSNNVKNALKVNNNSYTYDFTAIEIHNNGKDTFVWKRKFLDSTAVQIHGSVTVKQDEIIETKADVIDFLLNENLSLHNTIEEYKTKASDLTSELDKWKNEFHKLVDIKTSLENTLYPKFVELLNSKKQRIQLLENHINNHECITD